MTEATGPALAPFAIPIVQTIRQPLLILDSALRVRAANPAFYETFRLTAELTEGRPLHGVGEGEWDIPALRGRLETILPAGGVLDDFEVDQVFPRVGRRAMLLSARELVDPGSLERLVLLSMADVTGSRGTFLRASVDALAQHIAILDARGTIVAVNDAWRRFAERNGWADPAAGEGMSYLAVCDRAAESGVEAAARVAAGIRSVLGGTDPDFRLEYPCHGPGEQRWFAVRATRFRHDGQVYAAVAHHDITSRRLAEQATARQSLILHGVVDALPVAVSLLDTGLRPVMVNPAARALWGEHVWSEDGADFASLRGRDPATKRPLHSSDWPAARALSSGQAVLAEEIELGDAAGETRVILNSAIPSRDLAGAITGVIVVAEDVTGPRQMEHALREGEQRYRSLFEHLPDAAFSFDLEGRFVSANPAAFQLSGSTPGALLGRSFEFMIPPAELPRVWEHFRAAAAGIAQSYQAPIVNAAGERVELAITNVPMLVAGEVTGVYGIARDITERHRLQEQLRQAQKMEAIGRLVGGIAHDFNNLLTAILNSVELASREFPAPSVTEDLEAVRQAAQQGAELVHHLLAFGRKQVLQLQPVYLNDVIEETRAVLGRMIGEHIRIAPSLDPDLGRVLADRGQLQQVLLNLAANARDAMPEGGVLTITTANLVADAAVARRHKGLTPGPYARLTVADSGLGMDPATLERIFEPFFTTKPVGEGSGLGLATAYGIIKQVGGFIYAESAPGKGTTFEILLPLVAGEVGAFGPVAPERESLVPAELGGSETILVVDDEPTIRRSVERTLGRLGYRVVSARDGAEALGIFERDPDAIDLVITDIVMPELGGRQLTRALRHHRPELPVLVISGYDDQAIVDGTAWAEGLHLLEKPFTLEELLGRVRTMLSARRR
jgi:two-component system cell cycle sensor histidine kinase/response regulator CckA